MSKLYLAHKGLGLFSSEIPLLISSGRNNEQYLISAVEHHVLTFRLKDLAILGTSERLNEKIISVTSANNIIFCGCKTAIFALKRAKFVFQKYSYEDEMDWKIVRALEQDGTLCGVSANNFLIVWDITTRSEIYACQFPVGEFDICSVIQPRGYKDKILIGSVQGSMHLINYRKRTTLYTFDMGRSITTILNTPDDNTVAIGCHDGTVVLHNVLYDKTIALMKHDLGAISSIAFREDLPGELLMLAGTENGHVTMWNLEKQCSIGQTRDCHHGAVSSLYCVTGQPLLVSNGPDNSIRVWNYDRPDGTPILFNSRCGHWMPPSTIAFWPSSKLSTQILSGGQDSVLNVFSTFEERHNFSMGRAYRHRGHRGDEQYVLPGAVAMGVSAVRDGFWDSVVLVHGRGCRQATTWSFSKRCRGQHSLDYSGFKAREFRYGSVSATAVTMTMCGNYAVVGYSSGHLVRYNVQSGLERGVYGAGDGPEVCGVVTGLSGNRAVLVSASVDGTVSMYDLVNKGDLIASVTLPRAAVLMRAHHHGGMVAVATDNGAVYLITLDGPVGQSLTVFRRLWGNLTNLPVTDVAFWHDSERVLVASGTLLRTFDYVNAKLIDCCRLSSVVTRVCMALNDGAMVTTHEGDLGLYVWAVGSMTMEALDDRYEPPEVTALPRVAPDNGDDDEEEVVDDVDLDCSDPEMEEMTVTADADTASSTFCPHPCSYLAQLLNLDDMRVQSEMAARGVSSTSFFLPQMVETLSGIRWRDDDKPVVLAAGNKRRHGVDASSDIGVVKDLHKRLLGAQCDADYDGCMDTMKELSVASVDHELKLLHPINNEDSHTQIDGFLRLLVNQFRRGRSMDLCRMYLAVMLRHNLDCVLEDEEKNAERTSSDPYDVNGDARMEERREKKQTLALLNTAVAEMGLAGAPIDRDLAMIEQMALLATLK